MAPFSTNWLRGNDEELIVVEISIPFKPKELFCSWYLAKDETPKEWQVYINNEYLQKHCIDPMSVTRVDLPPIDYMSDKPATMLVHCFVKPHEFCNLQKSIDVVEEIVNGR